MRGWEGRNRERWRWSKRVEKREGKWKKDRGNNKWVGRRVGGKINSTMLATCNKAVIVHPQLTNPYHLLYMQVHA